ncbi:DNA-binding protein inhibitor ID-2 [Crotalus adamanteus]|uniref:DNA-binding protein inhibitor ID-2 n=1 Tax=Crotalus adamanteus TaxID=8729 RepID=A0AAW1CAC5_CROAD
MLLAIPDLRSVSACQACVCSSPASRAGSPSGLRAPRDALPAGRLAGTGQGWPLPGKTTPALLPPRPVLQLGATGNVYAQQHATGVWPMVYNSGAWRSAETGAEEGTEGNKTGAAGLYLEVKVLGKSQAEARYALKASHRRQTRRILNSLARARPVARAARLQCRCGPGERPATAAVPAAKPSPAAASHNPGPSPSLHGSRLRGAAGLNREGSEAAGGDVTALAPRSRARPLEGREGGRGSRQPGAGAERECARAGARTGGVFFSEREAAAGPGDSAFFLSYAGKPACPWMERADASLRREIGPYLKKCWFFPAAKTTRICQLRDERYKSKSRGAPTVEWEAAGRRGRSGQAGLKTTQFFSVPDMKAFSPVRSVRKNSLSEHNLGISRSKTPVDDPMSLLYNMNDCYSKLKELVPSIPQNKKVSKMEILQHVIDYILDLQIALDTHPSINSSDHLEHRHQHLVTTGS